VSTKLVWPTKFVLLAVLTESTLTKLVVKSSVPAADSFFLIVRLTLDLSGVHSLLMNRIVVSVWVAQLIGVSSIRVSRP
jgi:hypothetical protein